jgi:hypothetical protein
MIALLAFTHRPDGRGLFFEDIFQLLFGRRSGDFQSGRPQLVRKDKKVAKIASVFFQDPFGLGFPALVVDVRIVKTAVQATMKIGAAVRACFSPARCVFDGDGIVATVASFHRTIFPLTRTLVHNKILSQRSCFHGKEKEP